MDDKSKMHKAEGERWTSDPDTVEVHDRYEEGMGDTHEQSGGITNRPLSEERGRQDRLPDRGTSRSDDRSEGDVER